MESDSTRPTDLRTPGVAVVDTETLEVITTIAAGETPWGSCDRARAVSTLVAPSAIAAGPRKAFSRCFGTKRRGITCLVDVRRSPRKPTPSALQPRHARGSRTRLSDTNQRIGLRSLSSGSPRELAAVQSRKCARPTPPARKSQGVDRHKANTQRVALEERASGIQPL